MIKGFYVILMFHKLLKGMSSTFHLVTGMETVLQLGCTSWDWVVMSGSAKGG